MLQKWRKTNVYEKTQICGIPCRKDILNQIAITYGHNFPDFQNIIHESGTGCGILFSELNNKSLEKILKIINIDLDKHRLNFDEIKKIN